MYFNRDSYLHRLLSARGNGMIKVITGIRRCGKSFLLFNIFRNHLLAAGVDESHIIEINLEDRRNKALRNPDKLLEYIDGRMTDKGLHYILIDEIQLASEFEDVLNSYLHVPNAEVYVTGSNAKFLSSDVITEFRGRGWEIRVSPLSFAEYHNAAGGEFEQALQSYYRHGGLPGAAQLDTPEEKEKYLRDVAETVYLRDVVDRNRLHNGDGLRDILRLLASAMGASTNVRRISNTFKSRAGADISPTTIAHYIACLQDAFIVSEALRYDVKGRKYIGTETKYYFEDTGIRNAVLNFRQTEPSHAMENVIYNELRRRGYSVDVGSVAVAARGENGKTERRTLEVDFVVNRMDERLYIQSALAIPDSEKLNQEQASLLRVPDSFRKVIIVGDRRHSNYNDNGILMLALRDFLLDENAIKR